jgi:uncharacterized protein YgiB involved in biofilm formation
MIAFLTTPAIAMPSRRSTATLTLVLIGAAALHGCGADEEETATRDVYQSRADCQRDWGDDDKKCEPATSGSHAGMFYGPLMYGLASGMMGNRGANLAPRPGSNAVASTNTTVSRSGGSVSRGGFGSSASSHSSGG